MIVISIQGSEIVGHDSMTLLTACERGIQVCSNTEQFKLVRLLIKCINHLSHLSKQATLDFTI